MTFNLKGLTVAAIAFVSSIAVAQSLQEITVQATRILNTKIVGRSETSGAPILDVSVSYGVKIDDLDLASHYGHPTREARP